MQQKKWKYSVLVSLLISIIAYGATMSIREAKSQSGIGSETGMRDSPPHQKMVSTDELEARVKAILANYDASNLSKEDAIAINNAFRNAGIRRGPGQREAIIAAGFDPQTISSLDPPPKRKENMPSSQE